MKMEPAHVPGVVVVELQMKLHIGHTANLRLYGSFLRAKRPWKAPGRRGGEGQEHYSTAGEDMQTFDKLKIDLLCQLC